MRVYFLSSRESSFSDSFDKKPISGLSFRIKSERLYHKYMAHESDPSLAAAYKTIRSAVLPRLAILSNGAFVEHKQNPRGKRNGKKTLMGLVCTALEMYPLAMQEEKRFLENISQKGLFSQGDKVLALYSGGPDSTFLLLMLKAASDAIGFQFAAFHMNHQIRSESAD